MATFALVHGAWHGGWCWERVAADLEARGHAVVAPDLPGEDPEAGASDYADVVCAALDGAGDEVVVVGHSLGGLTIPIVAARRPVRRLVFISAFLPEVGRSLNDQLRGFPEAFHEDFRRLSGQVVVHPDGSSSWPQEAAIEVFYADCDPDFARWAAARMGPQCWRPAREVTPLEAWPEVEALAVVCADDRSRSPDWLRSEARRRLGVEPVELPGGHCSFLARPAALTAVLDP